MPDTQAAREKKAANITARKQTKNELTQSLIDDPATNDELRRKLDYCHREIQRGREDGLVKRRDELIREAQRRIKGPSDSS